MWILLKIRHSNLYYTRLWKGNFWKFDRITNVFRLGRIITSLKFRKNESLIQSGIIYNLHKLHYFLSFFLLKVWTKILLFHSKKFSTHSTSNFSQIPFGRNWTNQTFHNKLYPDLLSKVKNALSMAVWPTLG